VQPQLLLCNKNPEGTPQLHGEIKQKRLKVQAIDG
jgi:hypothetical protein